MEQSNESVERYEKNIPYGQSIRVEDLQKLGKKAVKGARNIPSGLYSSVNVWAQIFNYAYTAFKTHAIKNLDNDIKHLVPDENKALEDVKKEEEKNREALNKVKKEVDSFFDADPESFIYKISEFIGVDVGFGKITKAIFSKAIKDKLLKNGAQKIFAKTVEDSVSAGTSQYAIEYQNSIGKGVDKEKSQKIAMDSAKTMVAWTAPFSAIGKGFSVAKQNRVKKYAMESAKRDPKIAEKILKSMESLSPEDLEKHKDIFLKNPQGAVLWKKLVDGTASREEQLQAIGIFKNLSESIEGKTTPNKEISDLVKGLKKEARSKHYDEYWDYQFKENNIQPDKSAIDGWKKDFAISKLKETKNPQLRSFLDTIMRRHGTEKEITYKEISQELNKLEGFKRRIQDKIAKTGDSKEILDGGKSIDDINEATHFIKKNFFPQHSAGEAGEILAKADKSFAESTAPFDNNFSKSAYDARFDGQDIDYSLFKKSSNKNAKAFVRRLPEEEQLMILQNALVENGKIPRELLEEAAPSVKEKLRILEAELEIKNAYDSSKYPNTGVKQPVPGQEVETLGKQAADIVKFGKLKKTFGFGSNLYSKLPPSTRSKLPQAALKTAFGSENTKNDIQKELHKKQLENEEYQIEDQKPSSKKVSSNSVNTGFEKRKGNDNLALLEILLPIVSGKGERSRSLPSGGKEKKEKTSFSDSVFGKLENISQAKESEERSDPSPSTLKRILGMEPRKLKGHYTPKSQFSKSLFEANAPDSIIYELARSVSKEKNFEDIEDEIAGNEFLNSQRSLTKNQLEKLNEYVLLYDDSGEYPERQKMLMDRLGISRESLNYLMENPETAKKLFSYKIITPRR